MSLRHQMQQGLTALGTAFERRRHPGHFILVDKTPWREIFRDGIMAVRHYSLPPMQSIPVEGQEVPVSDRKHRIPLLLIPALGIHCWTFDIMPSRSMVRYLMARGYEVYVIDWGEPSRSERNLSLSSYVNHWMPLAVKAVQEHSGAAQVNLLGYCMGGLLALMYLGSRRDAPVHAIATIASPVNFHKGGMLGQVSALLSQPALKIGEWFRIKADPFDSQFFHVPGKLVSLAFKMTNPPSVVTAYLDLVRHITDREYVTEYMTMGQWFNDMVDYPGATVREIIAKMVIGNSMANGQIQVGKCPVDFGSIRQDLLALAGKTDNICTIEAARDALRLVGSQDKRFEVMPGGHAGIFAGSKAPANTWRSIADWLDVRSD